MDSTRIEAVCSQGFYRSLPKSLQIQLRAMQGTYGWVSKAEQGFAYLPAILTRAIDKVNVSEGSAATSFFLSCFLAFL